MSTSGPLSKYSSEEVELGTAVLSAVTIYPLYNVTEPPSEGWVRQALSLDQSLVRSYVDHFRVIGVSLNEVREYVAIERRVLASLYRLAQQQVPSFTELRRLVYRYVLDARGPVCEKFYTYEFRPQAEGEWEYWAIPATEAGAAYGPMVRVRTLSLPLVDPLLRALSRTPPDRQAVVENLDQWFLGVPTPAETLEGHVQQLEFEILPDGKVRLWIGDRRVPGLDSKRRQELLRYLCEHPETVERGRSLEKKLGIPNVAALVPEIQKRLEAVVPEARKWLLGDPVRWDPGVRIAHRG
jgi:hypothetical protein